MGNRQALEDGGESTGPTAFSAVSVNLLNGIVDDLAGSAFLADASVDQWFRMKNLFARSPASAACPARVATQACAANTRSITYMSCTSDGGLSTLAGTVVANYVDTGGGTTCALDAAGKSVTRVAELTMVSSAGTATVTSANRIDFRGQVFGGGATLTKRGDGAFDLTVPGVSRVYRDETDATVNYEISMRSVGSTPAVLSEDLARGVRSLRGGSFEISEKASRSLATLTAVDVKWGVGTCCYPTSGSFEGSMKIGNAAALDGLRIEFSSTCGQATIRAPGMTDVAHRFSSCI